MKTRNLLIVGIPVLLLFLTMLACRLPSILESQSLMETDVIDETDLTKETPTIPEVLTPTPLESEVEVILPEEITPTQAETQPELPPETVSEAETLQATALPTFEPIPWIQMTDNAGWSPRWGHTSVVLHDGSLVVIGGHFENNDVWRSTDQGATWTQMTDNAGWTVRWDHTSVVLLDGSILLMGGYEGARGGDGTAYFNDVWRSTDQGATWTLITGYAGWGPRSGHTSVVLPDGSIVLMGGLDSNSYKNDVWRSADQGATWTKMTAAAPWTARVGHTSVAFTDGSIILMGGTDGYQSYKRDVWISTDMGATWTQITEDADWPHRWSHSSVALADDSILLMGGIGLDNSRKNDIWHSSDQGATWTQITEDADWAARGGHTSVVLWDGSIVMMGGNYKKFNKIIPSNDVWRLDPLAIPGESTESRIPSTPLEVEITIGANPVDSAALVYVPAGEFLMGDEREPIQIYGPQRVVYLDSFWIYQTPVTNAQFAAFVAETGYQTQAEIQGYSFIKDDLVCAYWAMPDGSGSDTIGVDSHPVVHINWYDASAYYEWAYGLLPTEAEWEKPPVAPMDASIPGVMRSQRVNWPTLKIVLGGRHRQIFMLMVSARTAHWICLGMSTNG
jgi:hypothetical protein